MPWQRKEQPTAFDDSPLEGLTFLNGDVLARLLHLEWLKHQKYPLITFPSGHSRELIATGAQATPEVHVFGRLTLPYRGTIEDALRLLASAPPDVDIAVNRSGPAELTLSSRTSHRSYRVRYDNAGGYLADVITLPPEAMELLGGLDRAILPPPYATEHQGRRAIAPLKFFTPDSGWTWYPTEFDGEDLFFGLVSGLEVELGYFSLSELESVRGPLGLPIERDLYYKPQTLDQLLRFHTGAGEADE